jgi:hypothetical protein
LAITPDILEIRAGYSKQLIFDKIERWRKRCLTELRDLRRGKVTVMETGLYIEKLNEKHFVPWAQVVRIDAKKTDAFIGDTISLVMRSADGMSAAVAEFDPEWPQLLSAISESLPGSLPYQNWALQLVADGRQMIEVYVQG